MVLFHTFFVSVNVTFPFYLHLFEWDSDQHDNKDAKDESMPLKAKGLSFTCRALTSWPPLHQDNWNC